ncbi:hypothetical protein L596_023121 [Steinernema carpocapsae]|uniref:Uncharacterized protein n=1 Tax=Steinernema carpocapsae TaxID=34508 RepID=A0A4U5MDI0_STECR|nr:hypothetical protein L596_023121 [Steinernema carpocapsae]
MHHRDLEKPVNESLEVIFDGIALIRDAQKNLYIQKDPDVCSSSVKNSANFSFVNFFHNYTIIPVEPEPEEEGPCTNKDKSGLKSPLLTIVMVILSSVVLFVFYAVIISCRAKKFQRMSEAKRKALELAKRGWLNMMEQSSTANDVSQVSRATQVSQISQVSQVTNDETEASRVQPVSQVSQVSQVSRSDGPDSQVSQVSRAGGVSQISQVSGVSQVSQAGGGDDDDEKSRVPTMAKKKGKADKQTALKPKDRTLATFEDF